MVDLSSLSAAELCARLTSDLSKLKESDQGFATSLLASVRKGGLFPSSKQRYWLEQLIERAAKAEAGEPERKVTAIGDMGGIYALFERARGKLKSPAIVIDLAGLELRLSVAGARARVPGSINVATNASYGESTWFGRILSGGQFEASPRVDAPANLPSELARFAASPAEVAAEHGRLSGKCCFCNTKLTDARSTSVGYGPTCAGNYGLPYPGAKEARARTADMFASAA